MAFVSPAPGSTPDALPSGEWSRLTRWIKLYSWAQVAFLGCLIVGAHFFPLIGKPWSTCRSGGAGPVDGWCVLFFHLYEVPLAVLFAYHAYFGFTQLTRAKLPYYVCLTALQLVMLFVFATFESKIVLDALARPAPTREIVVLYFAFTGMIAGSGLGFYTVFGRLLPVLLAERREQER
jgi:hypothetical protein